MTIKIGFAGWAAIAAALFFGVVGAGLWYLPQYKVYSAQQDGRATLARAEYAKQAQVQDAIAKYESAKYLKQAAGVIKESLSPEYLNYLKIQMQEQVGERNGAAVYFFDEGATNKVVVPSK